MDRKKVIIVCFVLVAVLYVVSLGVGFGSNTKEDPLSGGKSGSWTRLLDNLLGPFAPHLDVARLTCGGQPAGQLFSLTQARGSCSIEIPPAEGKKYRKGTLQFTGGATPRIYVHSDKDHCKVRTGEIGPGLALKVTYINKGESLEDPNCWLEHSDPAEPLRVVALEGGGTLTLERQCNGCDARDPKAVSLRLQ